MCNNIKTTPVLCKLKVCFFVAVPSEYNPELEPRGRLRRMIADRRSKKARQKHSDTLKLICDNFNVTIENSNLLVCEGRKVVHVLKVGELNNEKCFVNEVPTASFSYKRGDDEKKGYAPSPYRSLVIPNGWKVAVVVDGQVWTAEAQVTDKIKFRFLQVNEKGEEILDHNSSAWRDTPGAAFKSVYEKAFPDRDVGRHNGKLYVGCHYHNPQAHLRTYFQKMYDEGKILPEMRPLVHKWLSEEPRDTTTINPTPTTNSLTQLTVRSESPSLENDDSVAPDLHRRKKRNLDKQRSSPLENKVLSSRSLKDNSYSSELLQPSTVKNHTFRLFFDVLYTPHQNDPVFESFQVVYTNLIREEITETREQDFFVPFLIVEFPMMVTSRQILMTVLNFFDSQLQEYYSTSMINQSYFFVSYDLILEIFSSCKNPIEANGIRYVSMTDFIEVIKELEQTCRNILRQAGNSDFQDLLATYSDSKSSSSEMIKYKMFPFISSRLKKFQNVLPELIRYCQTSTSEQALLFYRFFMLLPSSDEFASYWADLAALNAEDPFSQIHEEMDPS